MSKLIVLYDNWCPNCSRFSLFIKKMDWLRRISICKLRDEASSICHSEELNKKKALTAIATYSKTWKYGFLSLLRIAFQIPVFWPFIPIMYTFKILGLGQLLYRWVALERQIIRIHCKENHCSKTL